jgi:hypothetical protein
MPESDCMLMQVRGGGHLPAKLHGQKGRVGQSGGRSAAPPFARAAPRDVAEPQWAATLARGHINHAHSTRGNAHATTV